MNEDAALPVAINLDTVMQAMAVFRECLVAEISPRFQIQKEMKHGIISATPYGPKVCDGVSLTEYLEE